MIKVKEQAYSEPSPVSSDLEFMQALTEVHSRIKKDITSDFTLANLDINDKELILEVGTMAFTIRASLKTMALNAKMHKWQNNEWITSKMDDNQLKIWLNHSKEIFDCFMNKMYLIAALNRNKEENYLMGMLIGEMKRQQDTKVESLGQGIKENLRPEPQK